MSESINIIPIICENLIDSENPEIKLINEIYVNENQKTKFTVCIFTSMYLERCRNIKIQLLLRHLETGLSLNLGTIDIIDKSNEVFKNDGEINCINTRQFLNIETMFPKFGKYILDVFLLSNDKEIDFYSKKEKEEIDSPISSVDILVKQNNL